MRKSHLHGGEESTHKTHRSCHIDRLMGGGSPHTVSGKDIGRGSPAGVRSGSRSKMPPQALARGRAEGTHRTSIGKELAKGRASGCRSRFAEGGHAIDPGFERKGERLEKVRKRAGILEQPGYAKGGKIYKDMRAVYEALHSHFENEPQMKRLRTTKADVYQGEPHHGNYHHEPRHKEEKLSHGGRARHRDEGGSLWEGAPPKKISCHRAEGGQMGIMGGDEYEGRIIPHGSRPKGPEYNRHPMAMSSTSSEGREKPLVRYQEGYEPIHKRASGGASPRGRWIQNAIRHPGALHKALRVPAGQRIPEEKLEKAEHSNNPTMRKRANLAETLKNFRH